MPTNPNTLFAGMWQVEMHTWAMFSGGPGSGSTVARRRRHWTTSQDRACRTPRRQDRRRYRADEPEARLRADPNRRSGLRLALRRRRRHLARQQSASPLIGRAGYYINIKVVERQRRRGVRRQQQLLAIHRWRQDVRGMPWGGDNHDIWIDPKNSDRLLTTHDGGMNITTITAHFHRVTLADRTDVSRRRR